VENVFASQDMFGTVPILNVFTTVQIQARTQMVTLILLNAMPES